ncbi:GGDEF domain-containing protein [Paenibacillus rhizosphaerae]|uniref:GGDEF domain-containing protein n=2 Tax=Paenibacillus TaxID=44249 RepID=A0A1R1EMP8_9BACL|nr:MULTISPECIES: diguanylate cyclase [Paenibacillus]OMF53091.1 GGDEF domain-containing protein [Paenibacillus rhizosphaerae]GIO57351.1 hypothetical protein J21TS7_56690 [Paenibacillus cineris]
MKDQTPTRRIEAGYLILVFVIMIQELLIFIKVYADQAYTTPELLFSLGTLAALLIGFFMPVGVTAVAVFFYLVSYFVWLNTYAHVDILSFSWLLLVPANMILASVIHSGLIRNRRLIERLEDLKDMSPQLDLDTSLGNKLSLEDAVIKHSNLAKRYPQRYDFCMAMFKIEFLPLVKESLGSRRYARLLLELSHTIQKQIRYEDYKFFIDQGRFVVLYPMTNQEHLQQLTARIKQAMMNVEAVDRSGSPLKLVVRTGALVFQPEQFSKYEHIDAVIAALERNTETDLIGEYV